MKQNQLIGIIGVLILLISSALPIAFINDSKITILPFYENYDVGESLWVWRDISAFAITYIVIALLSIFFVFRKMRIGILIVDALGFVAAFFIYVTLWMTSVKVDKFANMNFSYSAYGLLILAGLVLILISGLKTERREKYDDYKSESKE